MLLSNPPTRVPGTGRVASCVSPLRSLEHLTGIIFASDFHSASKIIYPCILYRFLLKNQRLGGVPSSWVPFSHQMFIQFTRWLINAFCIDFKCIDFRTRFPFSQQDNQSMHFVYIFNEKSMTGGGAQELPGAPREIAWAPDGYHFRIKCSFRLQNCWSMHFVLIFNEKLKTGGVPRSCPVHLRSHFRIQFHENPETAETP